MSGIPSRTLPFAGSHSAHLPRRIFITSCTILAAVLSASAPASDIQEPGFTETLIDVIPEATNGFGGMIVDSGGNLYYAANFADEIYKVPPGGPAAQFGSIASDDAQGVVIDGTTLYSSFTGTNQVFAQDLTMGAPVGAVVANVPDAPLGIELVPSGFGSFGGQLVAGTEDGVSIVNPANGDVTQIWDANTQISDVAFTLAGVLIVTDPGSGQLISVTDGGVTSVFAGGMASPDGVAVHPVSGEIFVADPSADNIWKLQPDGSGLSVFASNVLVDGGFFPSPIAFSLDGCDLFYATRETGTSVIYRISEDGCATAEPAEPVPALSWFGSIVLLLSVLGAAYVLLRRRTLSIAGS